MNRLSLDQRTTHRWTVAEAVDGRVRHGIPAIGPWRDDVAAHGPRETAALVRDAGPRVSSLCRGGFLDHPDTPMPGPPTPTRCSPR